MLKVITGEPRSGKTLFAVREIILKNYEWDSVFYEWRVKKDVPAFVLFTNIDGLRLPHVNIDDYFLTHNITVHDFFTLDYFTNVLLKQYPRVLILLDEAHGYFPSTFKELKNVQDKLDKDRSVFFFFGYHGHYPIDIYLITHHWTDISQSITHKCEYQIDARKRTLSAVGEFSYNFMDGFEVLHTEKFLPDRKIFALYRSNKGEEFHSKKIRPLRRLIILILVLSVISVAGIVYWFSGNILIPDDFDQKSLVPSVPSAVSRTGGAAGARGASAPAPPVSPVRRASSSISEIAGLQSPAVQARSYVQVPLGGAWLGSKLVAIDLFGQIVRVRDFPFAFTDEFESRRVVAMIPDDMVGSLRPGLWVDSARILNRSDQDEDFHSAVPVPTSSVPGVDSVVNSVINKK